MKVGRAVFALLALLLPVALFAAEASPLASVPRELTTYVPLLIGMSLLSLLPAALIAMTPFTRIIVTLSFLRHALGMPETPPNAVLIILSLFLTFFITAPTLEQSYRDGLIPFLDGTVSTEQGFERSIAPLERFMTAHVRTEDVRAVAELAHLELTESTAPPLRVLVPAYMLSELRAAFVAGFMIFLPFLLIDLVVAAVLMALGMMMVPPASISLPLKVMLFVLIDGWSLLLRGIAGAYL
jgi:flagellar biosynthetic protein FliP